jgi:hypothetical protein
MMGHDGLAGTGLPGTLLAAGAAGRDLQASAHGSWWTAHACCCKGEGCKKQSDSQLCFPVGLSFAAKRPCFHWAQCLPFRWDAMASLPIVKNLGGSPIGMCCCTFQQWKSLVTMTLISRTMSAVAQLQLAQLRCFETHAQFKFCASRRLNGYAGGHVS